MLTIVSEGLLLLTDVKKSWGIINGTLLLYRRPIVLPYVSHKTLHPIYPSSSSSTYLAARLQF